MPTKRDVERRLEELEAEDADDSMEVSWATCLRYLDTIRDDGVNAPSPAERFGEDADYAVDLEDWTDWQTEWPVLAEYIETLTAVEQFGLRYQRLRPAAPILKRRFDQEGADFEAFLQEVNERADEEYGHDAGDT